MKLNHMFKKGISVLLIASMFGAVVPVFAQNDAEQAIIFKEDYQNIEVGGKPAYGVNGWSGDTSSSHEECSIGVVDENGNKSFRMEYIGDGTAVTADPLIYRNISVNEGETHVFYTKLKTDDTNRYKQLFLRTAKAESLELFSFNGAKVLAVGAAVANLKKGKWYEVKVVLNGTDKMADVYIDGVYSASRFLKGYDMTNMSIRVNLMGANGKNTKTNIYVDNTAYAEKNINIAFEESETEPMIPEGETQEENPSDLTNETEITEPDISVFCLDNTKAYFSGEITDTGIKTMVYRGNTMIPVRNIAKVCKSDLIWDEENSSATFYADGRKVCVTPDAIEIDGVKQEIDLLPQQLAGRLYLDVENTMLATGKEVFAYLNGAVAVYDKKPDDSKVSEILGRITYSRPSAEQILADYEKYNPDNSHPRVLIDKKRLEVIKNYLTNDSTFQKWYVPVKLKADKVLDIPVSKYELRDGERLLYVSQEALNNILYTSFVYMIEGDKKYFERAVAELMAVAEFSDWHPEHFLDTAEMTFAVALGYDWLYDSLSQKQKDKLAEAILRLGLDAANGAYEETAEYSKAFGGYHNRIGWKNDSSNWGLICNGGIASGALALMGDYETEYCADIISKAFVGLETPMKLYAPDGAWVEGVGYWGYACQYMWYMLSTVKNTLGTNYDYTKVPGILATANFPIYHVGPKGSFNYSDSTESGMSAPVLFWFANELGEPALNDAKLGLMEKFGYNGDIMDILFYNPELESVAIETEKDKKFRRAETAILTNSTASPNANYLAIKGGKMGESHGDLDAGTFVMDAIGERWASDLGSDSYTLPGYFEWPHRANYYRKRAEGHSTLVLNPDGGLDQKLGAIAEITQMRADTYGSCVVLDMSAVYAEDAKSVRRAAVLFDNRSKFMIQDEVICENPTDIYWFMQTAKKAEIAPNGKSLILTDGIDNAGGKRMKMVLQSTDKKAVFTVTPAEPLEISPQGEGQTKNSSIQRIQVKSSGVKKLNMQVIFIPYLIAEGCDDSTLPALATIDDLLKQKNVNFKEKTHATLSDLRVNGERVQFFDETVKYYNIGFEADYQGSLEVSAESEFDVTIKQPETFSDMAVVEVSDASGQLKPQKYFVRFSKERRTDKLDSAWKEVSLTGVEASATVQAENTPENTLDGNLETKWAADGSQWIQYDMGSLKKLSAVGIQWMTPTKRTQRYSLEVSTDGENWMQIFSGTSLGTSEGMEYVIADSVEARYVRVSVKGTTAGTWTSLMETKVYSDSE